MDDSELLADYTQGSESAFTELVGRHLDLVHSAALRLLDGDAASAEDLTQQVFMDLARKAAELKGHTSLTGWLYTSTRFLAANQRRSAFRRRSREEQAHMPDAHTTFPEPGWDDLRPLIDDVMGELAETDRNAILLRVFQSKPFTAVGQGLGISESAARMRVERALEKLRLLLEKRGISAAIFSLSALLAANAVAKAPSGLLERIGRIPRPLPAAETGILAFLLRHQLKLAAPALGLLLALPLLLNNQENQPQPLENAAARQTLITTTEAGAALSAPDASVAPSALRVEEENLSADTNQLLLTIVDEATGNPIPNVLVDSRASTLSGFKVEKIFGSRLGLARVPLAVGLNNIQLTTRVDDYADTRLQWYPSRGEVVPREFTLRVARPVKIGGTVVDADRRPVSGAKVGFNHEESPSSETSLQSQNFSWVEVKTDSDGRWQINRIGAEVISRIYGGASHPEHVRSEHVYTSRERMAEQQLREGTHVFRLGRTAVVTGIVVDEQGTPITDAAVLVGSMGESGPRQGRSNPDGSFSISGCKPGKNLLSAEAEGFAPNTIWVEITDAQAHRIILNRGKTLRVRVLSPAGDGVPEARGYLDTLAHHRGSQPTGPVEPSLQSRPNLLSDADGLITWSNAPDREMVFTLSKQGYIPKRDVRLRPTEEEQIVRLESPVRIVGTVVDQETGQPIPEFRIVTGWPGSGHPHDNQPMWSPQARFTLKFVGGRFEHTYTDAVITGTANKGYILKFEAEDYASHISPTISPDAGEVRLDVRLTRSAAVMVELKNPDGSLAAHADLAFIRPPRSPHPRVEVVPGGLSASHFGGALHKTDREGKFRVPSDPTISHAVSANAHGYALISVEHLKPSSQLHLQPWGRIVGTVLREGKPLAGQEIQIAPEGLPLGHAQYETKTSATGEFVIEKAPPGLNRFVFKIPAPPDDSGREVWSLSSFGSVEVLPAQTAKSVVEVPNFPRRMRPGHSLPPP